jgi:hypothetical protein
MAAEASHESASHVNDAIVPAKQDTDAELGVYPVSHAVVQLEPDAIRFKAPPHENSRAPAVADISITGHPPAMHVAAVSTPFRQLLAPLTVKPDVVHVC